MTRPSRPFLLRPLTKPTALPLTLAEAKAHLKVEEEETAEDELIPGYVASAADYWSEYTGRPLLAATYRAVYACGSGALAGLGPEAGEILEVSYQSADNTAERVVLTAGTDYKLLPTGGVLLLASLSVSATREMEPVAVDFAAGYASSADVPPRCLQAVRLLVGHFYEQRQVAITGANLAEVPLSVRELMDLDRLIPI